MQVKSYTGILKWCKTGFLRLNSWEVLLAPLTRVIGNPLEIIQALACGKQCCVCDRGSWLFTVGCTIQTLFGH